MRRIVRGAALAAAFLTLAGAAEAQSPVSLGIAGGLSIPTGDASDFVKSGYHGQAMVGFHLPVAPVWFRVDGFYSKFDGKDQPFMSDASARVIGGTANIAWDIPSMGPVRAYVIGGAGMYNIKSEATVSFPADLQLGISSGEVEDKVTEFGLNGGVGVRFQLAGITPFVEARYHSIFTEGSKTNVVPVSFGIMFR